jgi:hypothetical protein
MDYVLNCLLFNTSKYQSIKDVNGLKSPHIDNDITIKDLIFLRLKA